MDQNLGSNYLGMSKGDVDTQVKKTGGSKNATNVSMRLLGQAT